MLRVFGSMSKIDIEKASDANAGKGDENAEKRVGLLCPGRHHHCAGLRQ